jgi:anti-sigma B factor antagonist
VEIEIKTEGTIRILSCQGRLDAQVSGILKERVQQLLDEGVSGLVVNLEGVDFLDSSGLGALVASLRKAKEKKGDVKLAGLRPDVRSIFDITRVARLFQICRDVPEAVKAFEKVG